MSHLLYLRRTISSIPFTQHKWIGCENRNGSLFLHNRETGKSFTIPLKCLEKGCIRDRSKEERDACGMNVCVKCTD